MGRCYLLDASALVTFIVKNPEGGLESAKKRLVKLFASRRPGRGPVFFVPNVCMAECSKAFAKIFLDGDPSEARKHAYQQHVDSLLDWVSSKRKHVIKTYKLKREHLVGIEDIFTADNALTSRDGQPLSGLDGIIVSMGRTLERQYGKGNVFILTTDARISKLCQSNADSFPRAVDLKSHEIPGT